jgi:UDP-glucuronate decarboxylase
MRVLVTGGAGFSGSGLCERLVERGDHVLCVDNFQTGKRANIQKLSGHAAFEVMEHDITEPLTQEALASTLLAGKVDRVFNLACPASPPKYQHDPIHTAKTSMVGTLYLLELAHAQGARILHASTSEIYGDPMVHPQHEGYWGNVNPIGPRSCYDEGKRAAETLCFDFHRQLGVDIRVVRIFNTYGPRMQPDDGRVVSAFIDQALRGQDLTIFGEGHQTRSFCYVEDLLDGLLAMMDQDDHVGPINLGNPQELSIRELAEKIIAFTGSTSGIIFKRLPVDDPTRRRPDISLARDVLGFAPKTPLNEGLAHTVPYFRQLVDESPE